MYDTSFDRTHHVVPAADRRLLWTLRIAASAALAAIALAAPADGQMPGAPVLQNAWATPGLVGAVDLAGGSDGSTYAAAVGWTPGSGRFQLSGGIGAQSRTGAGSRGVYGVRAAMPFGNAAGSFGFAAFAGVGGGTGAAKKDSAAKIDSVASTTQIPLGAAIGWRHTIGATHGLSAYATPAYVLFSGGGKSGGIMRVAIGADVGITSSLGATVGADFGGSRPRGVGGPSGTQYGVGVSYAFGKR